MIKFVGGEKISDTAVCIGNFDGVHRAHRQLIERTVKGKGPLKSAVYTFYPHPSEFFGVKTEKITSEEEKDRLIESLGADVLYKQPCNAAFLAMTPDEFAENILKNTLGAKKVFVGYDFTFGKNSSGTGETLVSLGKKYGFEVEILPELKTDGGIAVKSTAIRGLIKKGEIESANDMLGRAFSYSGEVFHGKRLGRKLGFPTANIYPEDGLVLPPYGVYATKTTVDGKCFFGISNVGVNPTVESGSRPKIETHIMDFDGDIYGKRITVSFYAMIRKEQKFENADALKEKIKNDLEKAKKIIDKTKDIW